MAHTQADQSFTARPLDPPAGEGSALRAAPASPVAAQGPELVGRGWNTLVPAIALLSVAYVVAGKPGLQLAVVNASATAVWPPTGIALAAVLLLGSRVWPGVLLRALLVNLTTAGSAASSLGIAIGNTLEALVGGCLVTRLANGRHTFERPQDLFKFVALAGVVATFMRRVTA